MSASIDVFEAFDRIHPGSFISQYSDWILFTLLIFFFWSVVGISLKKRFPDNRYLRALVTATALMLAVGTYFSIYRGWLHLSLQGLGLLGAFLVLIIVFFVIYGLIRGYGMSTANALPLGFILFYLSLWAVSPNILHNIADIFPQVNGILGILFFVSLFKMFLAFFHYSNKTPNQAAKEFKASSIPEIDFQEIETEIKDDKKERKLIKNKAVKLTNMEIKSMDHIRKALNEIVVLVRKEGNSLSRENMIVISERLKEIASNEDILNNGLNIIKKHVDMYSEHHKKDVKELEERLRKTKGKKKRKIIEEEIYYQKSMLDALSFMEKQEPVIRQFTKEFNQLVYSGMQKAKNGYPVDALPELEQAFSRLRDMRNIFKNQKEIEKYLVKLDRKVIKDLEKEKDP